jgi:prepilin-type N-terminal cleavage/methylation domain-containing protein
VRRPRAGFTLFEVILAIALAAVLLTLIGTAINLYLVQVDAGRTRVEEAQLARSVLSMIADDIRATTVYKPQDTSAIAQLMSKTAKFNVDDIDKASAASTDGADTDTTLPLGLNGSLEELYVDATRLPKQEELFGTTTGYTNAQSPTSQSGSMLSKGAGGVPATDLKTVRYYIRPGDAVETGSANVTSLDPAAQAHIGGLVRQEIPRAMRNFAEKNGGSTVLDSNAVLLAPEVVRMEIRYFNGSEIAEAWDMKEQKSLPVAVEVRIWLRSPNATNEPVSANYDTATTHEYRQVVYVPMAQVANAAQSSSASSSTTDSTNSTDSSSGNSAASAFGQAQ